MMMFVMYVVVNSVLICIVNSVMKINEMMIVNKLFLIVCLVKFEILGGVWVYMLRC